MFTSITCQAKYMNNNCCLTSTFAGSYQLFKFIISKYNIYNSQVKLIARQYGYGNKRPRWDQYGVPLRVWNLLYKDLTILKLSGNINFNNLEELYNEYEHTRKIL